MIAFHHSLCLCVAVVKTLCQEKSLNLQLICHLNENITQLSATCRYL